MTNTNTTNLVNQFALMTQIYEMSLRCSLTWHLVSPGQFGTGFSNYQFTLTRTTYGMFSLDILKGGLPYTSYNSIQQPDLAKLYDMLSRTIVNPSKAKDVAAVMSNFKGCIIHFDEVMQGGILNGGTAPFNLYNSYSEVMSGGIFANGMAFVLLRTGGVLVGGAVTGGVRYYWLRPTGGARLNGTYVINPADYRLGTSGGALMAGAVTGGVRYYWLRPTGGARLNGTATVA